MKRSITILFLTIFAMSINAQTPDWNNDEASEFKIIEGQCKQSTPYTYSSLFKQNEAIEYEHIIKQVKLLQGKIQEKYPLSTDITWRKYKYGNVTSEILVTEDGVVGYNILRQSSSKKAVMVCPNIEYPIIKWN